MDPAAIASHLFGVEPPSLRDPWTIKHSCYANMGGVRVQGEICDPSHPSTCHIDYDLPLNNEQLTTTLQLKIIDQILDISFETIEDRNKFDMLARSLKLV
jgi:hypothetical protein